MLNVHQALVKVLRNVKLSENIMDCDLTLATGKILREVIRTDRPYPPFNKSLMDGIGVSFEELKKGIIRFTIEKVIPAGVAQYALKDQEHCVLIMTGAVIPMRVDCIIPIEHVLIKNGVATIKNREHQQGQFIRYKGQDCKKGDTILKIGEQITPVHLGVLASVGKKTLKVTGNIKVAVISTGDELVDVDEPIQEHQTRLSNAYALKAMLDTTSFTETAKFHFKDDPVKLKKSLDRIIKQFDLIILSGGVSKGIHDHVPNVLKELKVTKVFHGVDQKPGKPLWFGISQKQKAVFALPGNPASTLVCAYRYIVPFLYKMAGGTYVPTMIDIKFARKPSGTGTIFIPVKNGDIIEHGGSGDFNAWAQADGFIEYDNTEQGPLRPYFSWRL